MLKIADFKKGDSIKIKDIKYIEKTIMDWKNGDVLSIKEVELKYNRILVNNTKGPLAEYIYDYELEGIELHNEYYN